MHALGMLTNTKQTNMKRLSFKNYVAWFFINYIGVLSIMCLIPIGVNGESAAQIMLPAGFVVLIIVTAIASLPQLIINK